MLNRKRYDYYRDKCTWDDLYLVFDHKGTIVKIIIFWDDEPEWQDRAQKKAIRICRWLNRTPPLRMRLARLLTSFDPVANHDQFHCMSDIADYLYRDMEDHAGTSA